MKGVIAGGVALCLLLAGCATGPRGDGISDAPEAPTVVVTPDPEPAGEFSPIDTRKTAELEKAPLGLMARKLGEVYGGGIVLMHGLNMYALVGPISLVDEPIERAVHLMAQAVSAQVTLADGYYFVHAPGPIYESLNALDIAGDLDDRYREMQAALVFGVDTPLFNALALLGHTLDITIVADNSVAEALTGELALGELPLSTGLEALLKSSRTSGDNVSVESTSEYIFLRHVRNQAPASLLIGGEGLAPEQAALLDRRVSLSLPIPNQSPKTVAGMPGANALSAVLPTLSKQLGVVVRAEPGLDKLPINPVVMNDVRIRTAMDLLLRQWVLPEFAYELSGDVIVIRHVGRQ